METTPRRTRSITKKPTKKRHLWAHTLFRAPPKKWNIIETLKETLSMEPMTRRTQSITKKTNKKLYLEAHNTNSVFQIMNLVEWIKYILSMETMPRTLSTTKSQTTKQHLGSHNSYSVALKWNSVLMPRRTRSITKKPNKKAASWGATQLQF